MKKPHFLTKHTSIIYRQGNRFYDRELSRYNIGCGQQFFLLRIYENEGISMVDLAQLGFYDKGTVTKAVQKLEEQGYIAIKSDPLDKRIRRVYTTREAQPIIEGIYDARRRWNEVLTAGMTDEEAGMAEQLLDRMADNAYQYMNRKEPDKE
ncbi:MarR family winged helix-turn-helix transcriptional regulator [Candidatus Soleaferrea massiliensis]|uniref:MarR family winged helix-turn-helix transcriptional regulator n=1 Tax=Candidatus Soleaferrea massiliensis TaxID=1470354 RepID=UPI00058CBBC7|nr:MarR family transcriptional regulator [Candidatus Soleaferrea massiliensis]